MVNTCLRLQPASWLPLLGTGLETGKGNRIDLPGSLNLTEVMMGSVNIWSCFTNGCICRVSATFAWMIKMMVTRLAGSWSGPDPAVLMKLGGRLKSSWIQSAPTVLKCHQLLWVRAQKIASPHGQKACSNEGVLTLHCLIARINLNPYSIVAL